MIDVDKAAAAVRVASYFSIVIAYDSKVSVTSVAKLNVFCKTITKFDITQRCILNPSVAVPDRCSWVQKLSPSYSREITSQLIGVSNG